MTIGERIRVIREYLGMTQDELGHRIGRAGSHVSKLERGVTALSDVVVESICKATGARREWMLSGEGSMLEQNTAGVDITSIGVRIRQVRRENGLTQTEFAQRIESSLDMVSRTELGKTTPSKRWLQKVSSEFQISIHWLLTGQEGEEPIADKSLERIADYLRGNEIARIAVMEAINAEDDGIWIRLEQLVRERKEEG